jgi:hypothetical protein
VGKEVAANAPGKHDAAPGQYLYDLRSLVGVDGALLKAKRKRVDLRDLKTVIKTA